MKLSLETLSKCWEPHTGQFNPLTPTASLPCKSSKKATIHKCIPTLSHKMCVCDPLCCALNNIAKKDQIKFKLATDYHTLSTQQLTYLVNLLHFSDISRTLRSSISKQLFVPQTNLNIGKCAFLVTAPTLWSQLPIAIKSSETIDNFRKNRKHICMKLLSTICFRRFHAPMTTFDCPRVCQMILFVAPLSLNFLRI